MEIQKMYRNLLIETLEDRLNTLKPLDISLKPSELRIVLTELKNSVSYTELLPLLENSVFRALRHYQKQGLCEGDEYDQIEKAINLLAEIRDEVEDAD